MSLNYPIPQVACNCLAIRPDDDATHVAGCEDGVMVLYPISAIRPINNISIDGDSLSSLDLLGCSALPTTNTGDSLIVCDNEVRSLMPLGAGQSVKTDGTSALQPYDVGLSTFSVPTVLQTEVFSAGFGLVPFTDPAPAGEGVFELSGRHYLQGSPDGLNATLANVTLAISAEFGIGDVELTFQGVTPFGDVHYDARRPGDKPERFNISRTFRLDTAVTAVEWSLSGANYPTPIDPGLTWGGDPVLLDYHVQIDPLIYYAS